MPSTVSHEKLGEALLESVKHGGFPQSEQLASASVPAAAIPKLLEIVGKARDETKEEIRTASREAAPDVDGWIAQARRLQSDIKRSQDTAREIVEQSEKGKEYEAKVQDATGKVSLLYSEIDYNESLIRVVELLKDISALLDTAQDAAVRGNIIYSLERLEDADNAFTQLEAFESTRVVSVLKNRADQLRTAFIENMTESWNALLVVDAGARRVSFKDTIERDAPISVDTVVEAITKLGLLDQSISRLSRNFDKVIVSPCLTVGTDQVACSFIIDGDDIQIDGHLKDMQVRKTIEHVHLIAEYLSTRLPPAIAVPLSDKLVPVIARRLISNWLLPAVPLSTDGVPEFQETLSFVLGLADTLEELEWTGQDRLREWVDKSADIWLAKQKQAAIARVHALCPKRVREKRTVERVETQIITKDDALHGHKDDQEEDWGEAWGDEDDVAQDTAAPAQDVEEEDMSAWDDGDEAQDQEPPTSAHKTDGSADDEEVDPDAWGWGDEDNEEDNEKETQPAAAASSKSPEQHKTSSKAPAQQVQNGKEVTLRETYTVTAIPDAIMEIITQVVHDVYTLNQPDLATAAITPASVGLYAVPGLLLAMYRATAGAHYSRDPAGNMLMYNDCTRLSDRLRTFLQQAKEQDPVSNLPQHLWPSARLDLSDDLTAIEGFGKRAYGREMESQRTIIRDLLDGAQGFQSCTTAPFAAECDNAVAMVIDRIEEVKRLWHNVLSHSALLQSLGSLVSTALSKFISDVEDMSDIAEAESKKLHSYCVSISSLSALFTTDNANGEPQDMTSIYTPNWFRFQYLGEILDSSLADIRYMWTDGELKLEMEAEEVIDLIKALFAESDYRRKAVSEIRRTSIHR